MARTAGAISNVAISLSDLFRVLGMECPEVAKLRKIVVSKKWLDAQTNPCDMVTITADQLAALQGGLAVQVTPLDARPAQIARHDAPRAGMDEVPDLETLLG